MKKEEKLIEDRIMKVYWRLHVCNTCDIEAISSLLEVALIFLPGTLSFYQNSWKPQIRQVLLSIH